MVIKSLYYPPPHINSFYVPSLWQNPVQPYKAAVAVNLLPNIFSTQCIHSVFTFSNSFSQNWKLKIKWFFSFYAMTRFKEASQIIVGCSWYNRGQFTETELILCLKWINASKRGINLFGEISKLKLIKRLREILTKMFSLLMTHYLSLICSRKVFSIGRKST